MEVSFRFGKKDITLDVPEDSLIFRPKYEKRLLSVINILLNSVKNPIGCLSLSDQLKKKREGKIVIVVSDITRPIPYQHFLSFLINYICETGIQKNEILILVATGMHRASTNEEKVLMFGKDIVDNFEIIDHNAEDETMLKTVNGTSWSGLPVKLNKYYVDAGFRIITGLVEPHFMAGFSGGRKSICPGLASLDTVYKFHGYTFLNQVNATNGIMEGNPLNIESESVARICPADFLINIVLDQEKEINTIISGELFTSHSKTVEYVKKRSFVKANLAVDLVITSSGGFPLDNTFYQCVKGFVNCLPVVKEKGEIIALGSCAEGVGSEEYKSLMRKYAFKIDDFLNDIENGLFFKKDQWQFQMHARALKKVGIENLHFYTTSLLNEQSCFLTLTMHSVSEEELSNSIQQQIDKAVYQGKRIAVFPEGPYCSPILV